MSAKKLKPTATFKSRQPAGPGQRGEAKVKRTGRKTDLEAHLVRLNRAYAMLSSVNHTIVRVRALDELFDAVCRIAVEQGNFRMAWIGLVDSQPEQLRAVAQAGISDGDLRTLDIPLHDDTEHSCPPAMALLEGKHAVVGDIVNDPRTASWKADAQRLGYRGVAAFPLIVAGAACGALCLYTAEPYFFDEDELELLDELAADIAFAVEFAWQEDERRRALRLLEESEQRFQTLARISPVGIFRTNADGATTYVNPKWCEISGISADQAMGDGWLSAVHPEDRAELQSSWVETSHHQRVASSDYRFRHRDGKVIWVLGRAVPEIDSGNRFVGYVGTITDITERKRAEAALQASERQLSLIYSNISYGLVCLAVEPGDRLRFISVNWAFLKATGLAEDQIVGKLVEEVIPKETRDSVLIHCREAIRTKSVVGWEEVAVYPAGERYGDVSVAPILDSEGNCTHLVGTIHDFTMRKYAEEELRRRADESASLYEIAREITGQLDLSTLLAEITDRTSRLLGTSYAVIYLYDAARDELELAATNDDRLPRGYRFKADVGVTSQVVRTRRPVVVNEYLAFDQRLAEWERLGLRAVAQVPMIHHDCIIGVLGVGEIGADRKFTTANTQLLELLASQAAIAIQNARLRTELESRGGELERRVEQLEALKSIDRAITSSFDLQSILNVLLDHVAVQLHVDASAVLLLDPYLQRFEYGAGRGFRTRKALTAKISWGGDFAGRAALERRIVSADSPAQVRSTPYFAALWEAEGFACYHAVPLIAKGQVKGVLEVYHRNEFQPDQAWLEFLETLAGQAALAIDNAQLFENLELSNKELVLAYESTIEGWSHALDLRDRETEGHTWRVTETTLTVAKAAGIPASELVHVRRGALLHDIGKMGVPDSILLKPSRLTDAEWQIMQKHPVLAYELIAPIRYLRPALDIPYCHHEKWDGTGYPRRLKDEQIPLSARIFAVVDVWDALRSDRAYRTAWPEDRVFEYIRSLAGTQFDPDALELFLKVMSDSTRPDHPYPSPKP